MLSTFLHPLILSLCVHNILINVDFFITTVKKIVMQWLCHDRCDNLCKIRNRIWKKFTKSIRPAFPKLHGVKTHEKNSNYFLRATILFASYYLFSCWYRSCNCCIPMNSAWLHLRSGCHSNVANKNNKNLYFIETSTAHLVSDPPPCRDPQFGLHD